MRHAPASLDTLHLGVQRAGRALAAGRGRRQATGLRHAETVRDVHGRRGLPPALMILRKRTLLSIFNLALMAVTPSITAQVLPFEGRRIVDIQFSPAQILDPADLDKALKLHRGENLRAQDVADSIDGLFATGRFEDIVAEAEMSLGGVIVHFITKNTEFVSSVAVKGKVAT